MPERLLSVFSQGLARSRHVVKCTICSAAVRCGVASVVVRVNNDVPPAGSELGMFGAFVLCAASVALPLWWPHPASSGFADYMVKCESVRVTTCDN